MVSSIGSTSTDNIQQMMAQMYQKLGAADTDGTKGVSRDELSAIDSSGDVGGSAFLKSLSDQFDELDADASGELSINEIASAKSLKEPMGPPPGLTIGSSEDSEGTDLLGSVDKSAEVGGTQKADSTEEGTSAKDMIEELLQKLMASFAEGFSTSGSDEDKEKAAATVKAIKDLSSLAEKDGIVGLSKDELSAVDTTDNKELSKLVSSLLSKFDGLDSSSDGQLSITEMKESLPNKQFSRQELSAMSENSSLTGEDSSSNDLAKSFGDLTGKFVQKLINSYQDGGLSKMASSVGLTV